ncbi:UDP-N-acetylmuramoyl-L-alanyl-D-glutamate--2,6-diaminopimelate ligase, partial [Amycolatopsis sp. SID8362]|nr:UDP-N-acetylmuramoyl-L-alanyl-D-glutamate--2,6-diaminopimelate ligase [Amycolatopsis sp. SID8362]
MPESPVKAVPAPPRPARIVPVPLATLLARADARLIAGSPDAADLTVTGTTLRAQHVLPGDLFAAL